MVMSVVFDHAPAGGPRALSANLNVDATRVRGNGSYALVFTGRGSRSREGNLPEEPRQPLLPVVGQHRVEGIVERDDALQPPLLVDDRDGEEVVLGHDAADLLLVHVGGNVDDVVLHELGDGPVGLGEHQVSEARDARQAAVRVGEVQVGHGVLLGPFGADPLERGPRGEAHRQGDEVGGHERPGRVLGVAGQLSQILFSLVGQACEDLLCELVWEVAEDVGGLVGLDELKHGGGARQRHVLQRCRAQLLARLPDEREEDLRELASHPEHTAGSLMTTDFVTLPVGLTAGGALQWIRSEQPEQHAMTYLYFVGDDDTLAGVASLRDLVLAEPGVAVAELMEDDVVQVAAEVDEEEVGRIMVKYDLLAIPVVDEQRRLLGIVTLDDALDAVLPADWKQRLPRLFR